MSFGLKSYAPLFTDIFLIITYSGDFSPWPT